MNPDRAINDVDAASNRLGRAIVAEMTLEDARALEKSAAVRRLMGTPNPETDKPHSASSAEKVVESDEEYMGYRRRQYEAVIETQRAHGAFASAKLRAKLAVGLALVTS